MLTIDPKKVVEYGPPAVQQLGKLASACMKAWQDAPAEVRLEVGNAVALLNHVMITGDNDGNSNKHSAPAADTAADPSK